ncbi:MAG: AMP-binding protein, partial [bacterium]|nr:AMP-binding protein [bacterium]
NSLEFVAALLALWRLKATAIPLSFRLPNYYINKILKKTNASFLVSNPNSNTASNPTANTYDIENNLSWKDFPTAPTGKSTNISHESAPKILPVPMEPESEATVILTSGSTGSEKAALHTYGNHFYNALGSNENITLEPGDRWLLSLPLFHVGGLGILFRCFLAGAAVVIPEKSAPLSLSLTKHKITHASMVSTQLVTLMENKITKSHLKALLLGGSAFPEALIRKALSLNLPIYTTYGLSEMASQVTTTSKNDTAPTPPPGRLTSSGKILNFRTIKIENNEILVKGKTLFKGYLEKDSISIPLTKDGWFGTGDLGAIDAYGYLRVSGRKDNMFISGGENIMPEEIEALLL